ncbi:Uncharacterized conserved protein YhdP, contains DUF3971 and AsmA2 domains [Tistlia consotensis]|uniref:Uncharacterized conserved protein YhdP, contains DUF3971 and AsmA2 domains n=1 Tax=Tistlia consotensis USBA 355 TaxID=560819 RepID=A0A1Y6C2U6_9PROT|nr:AsmA-like C-terminal domain-containing protein [Tistlia consotensis]SMF40947.1 Uncharacterized conserved protein YhdP, contains DUF3971 and AsmA2 domains [Tistlia consotensis USBA 355]SNR74240.1 Uncharacterized conserved protein YhdP, contains DUF3971 and AsmA2 domains [Tistlia consotensis]
MVLKSCRIALEWVVAVIAGLALLAAFGLFWLSREPLPVDFVKPYIEAALSSDDGVKVEVGGTQLVWAGWGSRIEVAGQDWKVIGADGRRLLTIPDASIQLSLSALLDGQVAPTAITLRGLHISLLRRPDGRFTFGKLPAAEGEAQPDTLPDSGQIAGAQAEQSALQLLFSELRDKPDPNNPFAQLANVTIVRASALMIDQRLKVIWRAPNVDLKILRDTAGVSATGSATIALGDKRSRLDLTMTEVAGSPGLETVINVDSLEPAALAAVLPDAKALQGISGALHGRVGMTLAEDGRPSETVLELSSDRITLDLPDRLEQPLAVNDLAIEAHGGGLDDPFVLDKLSGSLAPAAGGGSGPAFSVEAIVDPQPSVFEVKLMAEIRDLPAQDLKLYWPKGVGGNGRPWVIENITAGEVTSATLSTSLSVDRDSHEIQSIGSFGGRFRYQGLEVHYLRPLPPLTDATGSAAYDLKGLDFTVEQAQRDDIKISNGGISIFGLEGHDHRISIVFDADGPLKQALTLLAHPRLDLLGNLGIDPAAASGTFHDKVSFAFPLVADLTFEQIQVGVEGKVADAGLKGGVAGYDLDKGQFDLKLDGKGLKATGTATLAGIPLKSVTWSESFEAVKTPTRVTAAAPAVQVSQLTAFGLDAGDFARGALSLKLDIAADHHGSSRIGLSANLQQVSARIPTLDWEKPSGKPGTLSAVMSIDKGSLTRIADLAVDLGDDRAHGEIGFAKGGGIARIAFDQLAVAHNSVTGLVVTPLDGGGYAVSVQTGTLDLAPLLGTRPEDQTPEAKAAAAAAAASQRKSGPPYLPLKLDAPSLSRVRLAEGRSLEAVSLQLVRDRRGWQLIKAQAQIPRSLWRHKNRQVAEDAQVAEKSMSVFYRPEADGTYRFELFADDIGATLRALGWIDSIEGGKGEIVGTLPGPLPDSPLNGRIETKGFRVVNAPAMAKLLTVASLTGIGNLLSGEGIEFDRAVGKFTLADDRITTPLFRAYGSSLGITAKGQIDLEGAETDVSGTLVPAYSVNRILGEIPILGKLLTGGEGEGILGVTYRVSGRIDDPDVSVNPLSILAPGFLRGLFSVPKPGGGQADELDDVFPSGEIGR